jgi:S-DNA-T family DNA segregation ATPase FtsK/SpoIIIE
MNRYSQLTGDALTEHLSNYLIDSWSYSGVSTFARNEKAFEMQYVYREKAKSSVSAIVGNAYHYALKQYFSSYCGAPDPVQLTSWAYEYLDSVSPNSWKLGTKAPTVEAAIEQATARLNRLLESFCSEIETYTDEIEEVLSVEVKETAWVMVNGVDIPLPCHAVIDLVVRLKDGQIVIIDHKSKSSYTDESEISLVHGQQAITYVQVWETIHPEMKVDEVWFIENKDTLNKDKSAQLRKNIIKMDADGRRLFEALLYEPLRRMIQAVADPDYIYTINTSDNLVDKAELYDFWARTQTCEAVDFEYVPTDKLSLLERRQRKIKDSSIESGMTPKIIAEFRKNAAAFISYDYTHSNMTKSEKIEHILRTLKIKVSVAHVIEGYSCDTYLLEMGMGVDPLSIYRYKMSIASALDKERVRILGEPLVVYEGKAYVGVEVNREEQQFVKWDKKYVEGTRIPLGIDNFQRPVVWDLSNQSTPHALVCGSTGSGKSVEMKDIIKGALAAGIKDITVLDPKWEFAEMSFPKSVKVISEIIEIEEALEKMVDDMNKRVKKHESRLSLVIFDEFADAADQSRKGKQLIEIDQLTGEAIQHKSLLENFKMLLQKGRSAGYRFVAATQRASVKTIPGDIKVNLPVQICFRVPKGLDSKVVIDTEGAEALAGKGDGLINSPEYRSGLVRFQAFYC